MILTVNGGSSSIKFALFDSGGALRRILTGRVERIGLPDARFVVKGATQEQSISRAVKAPDHTAAVNLLMDWLETQIGCGRLVAVGHRVVHGGPNYSAPARITPKMVEELRR